MTQLVKLTGMSRQTLHKEIAAGRLSIAKRGSRNSLWFDPDVAVKEIPVERNKYLSRQREGRKKGGRPSKKKINAVPVPDPTEIPEVGEFGDAFELDKILLGLEDLTPSGQLDKADLAIKLARARLGALAVQEKEGQLIAIAEVRKQAAKLAKEVIGVLAAIPGRLAQQLSAMTDANKIHALLEDEHNRAIRMVQKGFGYEESQDDDAEPPAEEDSE